MCPHDIYCVMSIPLAGGARATLQMAHLSSPLSKQYAPAARCAVLIPYARSFPCTPRLRRSRVSGRKKIAPAEDIGSYIRYVPGPTCRGSEPLYVPPLNYKRGGMQRYNTGSIWRLRLSSFHNNPKHSGVGCYAPAARTTLNSRVFMCLMFA
jgi:hypothetical protein